MGHACISVSQVDEKLGIVHTRARLVAKLSKEKGSDRMFRNVKNW